MLLDSLSLDLGNMQCKCMGLVIYKHRAWKKTLLVYFKMLSIFILLLNLLPPSPIPSLTLNPSITGSLTCKSLILACGLVHPVCWSVAEWRYHVARIFGVWELSSGLYEVIASARIHHMAYLFWLRCLVEKRMIHLN